MNTYENAKYLPEIVVGQKSIEVDIDGKSSFVPVDPDNRHYAEIKQQVDAGKLTIQEADSE